MIIAKRKYSFKIRGDVTFGIMTNSIPIELFHLISLWKKYVSRVGNALTLSTTKTIPYLEQKHWGTWFPTPRGERPLRPAGHRGLRRSNRPNSTTVNIISLPFKISSLLGGIPCTYSCHPTKKWTPLRPSQSIAPEVYPARRGQRSRDLCHNERNDRR
jgi:hypothetical protein